MDRADRPDVAADRPAAFPVRSPEETAELDDLARTVMDERAALDELARERERALAMADRLRARPTTRRVTGAASAVRRLVARLRAIRVVRVVVRSLRGHPIAARLLPVPKGHHRLRVSARSEASLRVALRSRAAAQTPAPAPAADLHRLLVIVRSAPDGRAIAEARAAIAAAGAAATRVVWVDPAGPGDASRAHPAGAADEEPMARSWADALRAADSFAPDIVVLLHADARPVEDGAIGRLIADLDARPDVAAVGARLVLGRRVGPALGPLGEAADLTVASTGLSIERRDDGRFGAEGIGRGSDPLSADGEPTTAVPAATAAALAVRREALDPDRGFLDTLDDLGPALDVRAGGGRVVVDPGVVLLHDEADLPAPDAGAAPWSHRLDRVALLDRLAAAGAWSRTGFHLGITVTDDDPAAGFGDWYTAHELGDAVTQLGWRVTYLGRRDDRWYEPPADLDAILVLIDLFDLARVPPGVIRIAWVRSWTDRWIEREWFDDYDIVLASSEAAKSVIEARTATVATIFPLATDPERFSPGPATEQLASDVAFVGSFFSRPRDIARGLPALDADGVRVGVWGKDWEHVPAMRDLTRGLLEYDAVADVYRSARIVVDDTVDGSTRDLGQLNSRVFDALAAGALVVTNNRLGAREVFGPDLPVWRTPADLVTTVSGLLSDDERRTGLVDRFRAEVLQRHTYRQRAVQLRELIADHVRAERWAIAIGPRTRAAGRAWGDTYFARSLQRQLVRRGYPTTVHVADEWPAWSGRADVVLHLFGARAPRPEPGPANLLWVISHPDRIDRERCAGYDRVFVASDRFADRLRAETDVPVESLHQATDPDRFRPVPGGDPSTLLFVGSSRGQRRPMVDAAVASGLDLAVYGGGWTADLMDLDHHRGDWIPNDRLAAWYTAADIVLADHYDDMRDLGFIANRIYDALACGAFVLSDDVVGLDGEFDGGAVACGSLEDAVAKMRAFAEDVTERRTRAERGRAAVLQRHTFDRRVARLIEATRPLVARFPAEIGPHAGSLAIDPAAPTHPLAAESPSSPPEAIAASGAAAAAP